MVHKVPSVSKGRLAAKVKGLVGHGPATTKADTTVPVSLSSDLKTEIQKIIKKYAANRSTLTPEEFTKFLATEQKVLIARGLLLMVDLGEIC